MTGKRAKLDDATLADLFDKAASFYLYSGAKSSDYALQETIVAAVASRIGKSAVLRTDEVAENLADILTLDDDALPATRGHIIQALAKAATAPDATPDTLRVAVYSLRETALSQPTLAEQADKALKAIAVAHPQGWQKYYNLAAQDWDKARREDQEQDLSLDLMRREITLKLAGPGA